MVVVGCSSKLCLRTEIKVFMVFKYFPMIIMVLKVPENKTNSVNSASARSESVHDFRFQMKVCKGKKVLLFIQFGRFLATKKTCLHAAIDEEICITGCLRKNAL